MPRQLEASGSWIVTRILSAPESTHQSIKQLIFSAKLYGLDDPTMNPKERARVEIDEWLVAAGWHLCDLHQVNLHGALGVALRELPPQYRPRLGRLPAVRQRQSLRRD
jgi:hypothetical protein